MDGNGEVNPIDRGLIMSYYGSNPTGANRCGDLDFDNDLDPNDITLFDNLMTTGSERDPARSYSAIGQHFGHQGLLYDPEIGSYQNRARQYLPALRRFAQRDPRRYDDGLNLNSAVGANPLRWADPTGQSRHARRQVDVLFRLIFQLPIAIVEGFLGLFSYGNPIDAIAGYGHYAAPWRNCHGLVWSGGERIPYGDGYLCMSGPPGTRGRNGRRWCPKPIDGLDGCAMVHDACYLGAEPGERHYACDRDGRAFVNIHFDPLGESQPCDEELCRCMNGLRLTPFSPAWVQREQMRLVFKCAFQDLQGPPSK